MRSLEWKYEDKNIKKYCNKTKFLLKMQSNLSIDK